MDVFYYWKCYEVDIDKKWLSRFVSGEKSFSDLNSEHPRYVWAFQIPRGCGTKRGTTEIPKLQLLARLVWSDKPDPKFPSSGRKEKSSMCYHPEHSDSVIYTNTGDLKAIKDITKLLSDGGLKGFDSNFQGKNGIQRLDGRLLEDLEREAAKYSYQPFWPLRASVLYNSPGNNKDCDPWKRTIAR